MSAYVVLVTMPSKDHARALAHSLVEEKLAACVNVIGELRSVYRWQDEVHEDPEALCIIKTTAERFDDLRAHVLAQHPYDTPEVIALPVAAGHAPYLDWIAESVKQPT